MNESILSGSGGDAGVQVVEGLGNCGTSSFGTNKVAHDLMEHLLAVPHLDNVEGSKSTTIEKNESDLS